MQTLLVIENNNSDSLKKLVNKIDFISPVFFQAPELALEWCEINDTDVVLVNLPKLLALEFVERFKTVLSHQHIPIIMMASTRDLELKIKALELNVTDFVSIPLEQIELVNRIKNAAKMREYQKVNLLAQKKILEVQKLEAVNCLTAGVAHEFNNLLMGIQGYADLNKLTAQDIRQAFPNSSVVEGFSDEFLSHSLQISSSVAKGKKMVEQMLLYCRRNEPPNHNDLNLLDFIKENTKNLREMLPKLSFKTHLEAIRAPIYLDSIDSANLAQIFWNICVNSRDALENNTGSVDITLKLVHENSVCHCCSIDFQGEFIKIDISDHGQGIKAELLPRIFDPFFTTKEVGSGTGLGLSVVAGLVHNAHGYIKVASIPHKKTTFSLFFTYKTDQSY
jgi:signal transduction histidine kinase